MIMMCVGIANAQSYSYSYTDPCNGTTKTLSVPVNGSVAVSYYGQIQSFSYAELTNGALQTWAANVYNQYGGNNPCASIVGLPTAINVTQGTVYNTINILGTLSMLADVASVAGSTNILGGATNTVNNSSSSNEDGKGDKKSNNSPSNTNPSTSSTGSTNQGTNPNGGSSNGSSTSSNTNNNQSNGNTNNGNQSGNSNGNSTNGSNSNGNGGSGSSSEGSAPGSGSSNGVSNSTGGTGSSGNGSNSNTTAGGSGTNSNPTQEEGKGSTNITAGGTNTVKSDNNQSSGGKSSSSKEGGKPTVIASSDFVGFNFKNSAVTTGLKATGGYSALRWDGARASGVLADYTSAQKGPNVTAYYAFIKPKSTTLVSATATFGFEGLGSQYATLAFGQMRSFKSTKFPKINKLKVVYMATGSYGYVYKEAFIGTALIAGGMYDFKVGKRVDIKIMNLLVYAPYVSYYNDIVLASPFVVLPSLGTNIGITKRFKFNINAGGAWAIQADAMNYTITMGTRLML
jgi:hypothetical protein